MQPNANHAKVKLHIEKSWKQPSLDITLSTGLYTDVNIEAEERSKRVVTKYF